MPNHSLKMDSGAYGGDLRIDEIGVFLDSDLLGVFMQKVGDMENNRTGEQYELFVDNAGQMMVQSTQSGRKFRLEWPRIVQLAAQMGIDETGDLPVIHVPTLHKPN